MTSIISRGNHVSRTPANVVKQPPFLLSSQKALEWWADKGLVYCFNPNRPEKGHTYLQPLEALQRVATMIKLCVADCKEKPGDYVVTQSVMASFFNDFKTKVFDVALAQDEAAGNPIRETNKEYARQKQVMRLEAARERARAAESRPKVFLPPRKPKKQKA